MELSGHEEDIPIPLNSSSAPPYGGGHHGHVHESHMIHHHHHHHSPNSAPPPPQNHILNLSSSIDHDNNNTANQTQSASIVHSSSKKSVRYRECLKNHAASMGGNATDGCGEFIPNGEEGSIESLTCSACNCHRNFHRKEIDGEPINFLDNFNYHNINKFIRSKKLTLTHPTNTNNLYLPPPPLPQDHHHQLPLIGYPTSAIPSRGVSYNMGSILSDSDEHEDTNTNTNNIHLMTNRAQGVKKRFRTKFTQEQKEKMMQFAEKAGWKLQKQEESVVQQFCQEIGVKRRVLKVWMHNNKHNLAKKNLLSSTSNTT